MLLAEIPVELVEEILRRLDARSAARAARCCRMLAMCVAAPDFAPRCCAVLGVSTAYSLEELAVLQAVGPQPPCIHFAHYLTMCDTPDPSATLANIAALMYRHQSLYLCVHAHGSVATERRARAVVDSLVDRNVPRARTYALGWHEAISKPLGWKPTAEQRTSLVAGAAIDVARAEVFFVIEKEYVPPLPSYYDASCLPPQEPEQHVADLQARVASLSPYARCDD